MSIATLLILWFLAVVLIDMPEAFTLALGGLLLRQVAVLFAHARSITLSLLSRIPGGVTGKTEYARWLLLLMAAREFLTFAALFLVVYLITDSWLFLGGALFTLATAMQLWVQARERLNVNRRSAAP